MQAKIIIRMGAAHYDITDVSSGARFDIRAMAPAERRQLFDELRAYFGRRYGKGIARGKN